MIITYIHRIGWFIGLVLLQVLILNSVHIAGYATPFLYIYFILKLIYWNRFQAGMVPLIILVSLTSSLQLFFIGLLGEYILSMNKRLMNRPLVVEEERLNFKPEKPEQE